MAAGASNDSHDAGAPVRAGTVTILIASVEGAAVLMERLGQALWSRSVSEYESVLSEQITRRGGTRVKDFGDGHMLVFASAGDALRCAVDVQRALPVASAPDMRVRMGLHTGEPWAQAGGLHGRTLVKAERIAGMARGGEVLVSSLVRELVEADGAVEGEIWFDEQRELQLRDLSGRHVVSAARWGARRRMRVLVADDSALVRDGVAAVLRDSGVDVVATAADAQGVRTEVAHYRPDVALVDIRMPPTHTNEGLVVAEELGHTHPEVGVLVLSQHLELSYAVRLLESRLARRGYLLKDRVSDIDMLLEALRRVAEGGCVVDPTIVERLMERTASSRALAELTTREREVLGLIAEGLSNRAIAERLVVTAKTVETHVGQIFLKLGLGDEGLEHRRVAAVLAYLRTTANG